MNSGSNRGIRAEQDTGSSWGGRKRGIKEFMQQ